MMRVTGKDQLARKVVKDKGEKKKMNKYIKH